MPSLTYQMLALDPTEKTRCENAPSLLYAIRSFTSLWDRPVVSDADFQIRDGVVTLQVGEVHVPADDEESEGHFGRAFLITLTGPFSDVEHRRIPLTDFLSDQRFQFLYVLRDEFSERIACQLYPHLYRIENLLRGYLIKFLSTRIGPTWWNATATREMSDKVKMRKKNELDFGARVDNSAYLIDFAELGEIVYEQSTGFVTREDIIKKLNQLPESLDALKELKAELQTNYQKFFRESFADRDFKDKWKRFEKLRNKIAHGNLFTANDLKEGEEIASDIAHIVAEADAKTDHLVITKEERQAIKTAIIEQDRPLAQVTEEEFMAELTDQERFFRQKNGFVGLARFVKMHLGSLGFDHVHSYQLAGKLNENRQVEIYEVPNPLSPEYPTAAIRLPAVATGT